MRHESIVYRAHTYLNIRREINFCGNTGMTLQPYDVNPLVSFLRLRKGGIYDVNPLVSFLRLRKGGIYDVNPLVFFSPSEERWHI